MVICHVISMDNINQMGDITRHIYNECEGEHIWCSLWDKPKEADVYILHCFKNYHKDFINWKKPEGKKLISLVHSSEPCMPNKNSDIVVTITNAWKNRLKNKYNICSVMIYGGIDTQKYDNAKIDLNSKKYGKISRFEAGKFHEDWEKIVNKIKDYGFENVIISNDYPDRENQTLIKGVKIDDPEKKVEVLSTLSVYADAHNVQKPFVETFCIALLEAMACGLPCVILGKGQEPMVEVIGNSGIVCKTKKEFEFKLLKLLSDEDMRKDYSKKSKMRAKFFDKRYMIVQWNTLLGHIYDINN